ncbi:MAG: N-acetyltransferase [Candidatus Neomarinimicrobiota bacterium]
MVIVRPEAPDDFKAIRNVNLMAFGQSDEADLVDSLRMAGALSISLVAIQNNLIVGHIAFSPVTIESEDGAFAALGLAPMAVLPHYQNSGIGSQLVVAGLRDCKILGHEIVVVLGHPEYYPRFGFDPAGPLGIKWEHDAPEDAFMIAQLKAGVLAGRTGVVKFHPAFDNI